MAEDKTKRIRELIGTLRAAGRAYYQESREIMSNFEYDKLYDEAIASPTIEERKANYFEVEKFFCDNTLNLILGWADGGFQYKSGYTGFYNTVETDFTYLDFAE